MKFVIALTLFYLIEILTVFSVTSAQNWGDWQLQDISNGGYGQSSSAYPSYAMPSYPGSQYIQSNYMPETQFPSASNQYPMANSQYSMSSEQYPSAANQFPSPSDQFQMANNQYAMATNQFPSASDQYPMASNQQPMQGSISTGHTDFIPSSSYTAQNYGQSPNTIDVHKVLDQFISSAGLSPHGNHEAESSHASSFAKWGTSPVMVFKKLFSFPFYLSSDPNVVDVYGKEWK